jgi:RND family efflux transporter MFP subunit
MSGLIVKKKLLPLFIVILGVFLGYYILQAGQQKPVNHNKNKSKQVRTVQISPLVKNSVEPIWNTSGFVIPAETVKVYARVSGNIMSINPKAFPGALLEEGQWLVKLEPIDLELALQSEEAQLEQAKANLSLVEADQILAKEELLLLNNNGALNIDESLVLRQPQLTVANAKILVAENNVEKAKLNLERSKATMPFSGKIITKDVGIGSKVSTNTTLFSVINTEVYWIEVKIPHKFLLLLDKQKSAKIYQPRLWGEDKSRQAKFISILPELDTKDRQVKVLLAIEKPQVEKENQPQVFINDFLNVELKGKKIEDAWTIKHSWLQTDNTIWVVDKNNTLRKRAITVLFKGREVIYVQAEIEQGDRALAEKPGIASIGLPVKTRKDLSNALREKNDLLADAETNKKQEKKNQKNKELSKGLNHAG